MHARRCLFICTLWHAGGRGWGWGGCGVRWGGGRGGGGGKKIGAKLNSHATNCDRAPTARFLRCRTPSQPETSSRLHIAGVAHFQRLPTIWCDSMHASMYACVFRPVCSWNWKPRLKADTSLEERAHFAAGGDAFSDAPCSRLDAPTRGVYVCIFALLSFHFKIHEQHKRIQETCPSIRSDCCCNLVRCSGQHVRITGSTRR